MIVYRNQIQTYNYLLFRTPDMFNGKNLYYVSISGIAICHFQGNSINWRHEDLFIHSQIPLDRIPTVGTPPTTTYYPQYAAKNWTVLTTLNAIENHRASIIGHAVDTSDIENPYNLSGNTVKIKSLIATKDAHADLLRVGYKADFLIYFDRFIDNSLI